MANTIETAPVTVPQNEIDSALVLVDKSTVKITKAEEYTEVVEILQAVKSRTKDLDTLRKSLTKGLDASKKAIMDLFRPAVDKLEAKEAEIKKAMISWTDKLEKERQIEEAKLRELARKQEEKEKAALAKKAEKAEAKGDTETAEALREQVAAVYIPVTVESKVEKQAGISYAEVWKHEVTDINLLEKKYMIADDEKLAGLATATKGTLVIPGVRFYAEKQISARVAY